MERSNPDSRTVTVVNMSPAPTMVEPISPCSSSSSKGSSSGMGNRNRSGSMTSHATAPPSKKQRASDDEVEQATPPRAPPPGPTSFYAATEAVEPLLNVHDPKSDEANGSDGTEDHLDGFTVSRRVSALHQDRDGSSDESEDQEETFLHWLMDQKTAGRPAGEMLDALGLGVADGAAVDDDELWEAMFSMGIQLLKPTVTRPREKLDSVNTLQDVASLLRASKHIVVLAGAGISVSCGIPDFRSENGIYNRLGEYNLPNPQCMFDIDFFRANPKPFFAFAKELFPKSRGFTFVPSPSHYFLKLLETKGKLLRVYSQNIDMLEHAAGIASERAVLCHGSFATATCLACHRTFSNEAIRDDVLQQRVPMCQACHASDGIVKPDIVFFGESLPRRFHDAIKRDERTADLVLVMGSSLKVNPVRSIVGRFLKDTPMILINREPVGRPHEFDVELLGYSDEIVQELCRLLDWDLPRPDPVLLGQSDLHLPPVVATRALAPLPFEFVPPSRHLFNGATSTYCTSSDEESNVSSCEGGTNEEEVAAMEAEAVVVVINGDEEKKATATVALPSEDQDALVASGNELMAPSSLDDK